MALNGGSPDIEPTMDPIKAYCRASQKAVSAHFTSEQILPFAIEEYSDPENAWMNSEEDNGCLRSHSTPPDSGNVVSNFQVD